jgi:hypothetical protein
MQHSIHRGIYATKKQCCTLACNHPKHIIQQSRQSAVYCSAQGINRLNHNLELTNPAEIKARCIILLRGKRPQAAMQDLKFDGSSCNWTKHACRFVRAAAVMQVHKRHRASQQQRSGQSFPQCVPGLAAVTRHPQQLLTSDHSPAVI